MRTRAWVKAGFMLALAVALSPRVGPTWAPPHTYPFVALGWAAALLMVGPALRDALQLSSHPWRRTTMDEIQLAPLTLPSGGTVEFVDIDDLTGADLRKIRATIATADSAGETTNKLLEAALILTIKTWDLPYLADPRTPEANPAALRKLKIRDLAVLERHMQPILDLMKPPKDATVAIDDTPGSPTPPGSE